MRSSHLRIDLLKLLILLGISAGLLPTRIKGLNNWFTNYIVADASDDVELHQNQSHLHQASKSTNVTSLVNGTLSDQQQQQLPAYNFSDSIVRVGAQTPGAHENNPATQVGENNQTTQSGNQLQEQAIDQLTSRQDSAPPPGGSTSYNNPSATASYGGASNHKNYPIEPYPSASYTSLAVQVPSPTTTSKVSPLATSTSSVAAAQASTLNSLLNRDYHHSFNLSEHHTNNNLLSLNHRTNVPSSQIGQQQQQQQQQVVKSQLGSPHADAQTAYAQILNHNFENSNTYPGDLTAAGGSSPLNTGLIQNLTAGLFPVAKLSNATLSSLSELLSKTKQQQQQQQQQQAFQAGNFGAGTTNHLYGTTTTGSVTNGYRPSSSLGGYGGNLVAASSQSYQLPNFQAASQQANNYLEALLGDHRFTSSVFDYLNQPSAQQPSQFGFREPSSAARLQSPMSSVYNRPVTQQQQSPGATNNQKHKLDGTGHHQTAPIPSNVYNTYAPFKEPHSSGGGGGKQPVTNGQMLNMAATLYDNYLDQNYRANQQYQFVQQQQQANNPNQLDKVVYHSTPFRPSIVSPPSSSQTLAGTTTPSSTMINGNYQRPRTEADVKSVSHASLNGNSPMNYEIGHPGQTNGQQHQQNFSKPGVHQPGRQVALGSTKFDDIFDSPFSAADQQLRFTGGTVGQPPMMYHQAQRTNSTRSGPHTSGSQQQQQQQVSATGKQQGATSETAPQKPASVAAQTTSALVGPQLLLDLYERAIDSQIQEAIYSDHQQHFQHLGPLASAGAQSSGSPGAGPGALGSAIAATNSNAWPAGASYDDTPYEPTGYTAPLTASGSSRHLTSTTGAAAAAAAMAAMMNSQQSQQSQLDPLASALSELPTFSASDLQPLIPGGATSEPVYSLLPATGDHSASSSPPPSPTIGGDQSDASNLAALIAQFTTASTTSPHSPHLSPVHNQQPMTSSASSLHQLLLGDYDQFSPYGPGQAASAAFPMASTVTPQTIAIAQPGHTQHGGGSSPSTSGSGSLAAGGLPSIFTKFTQSGQLSSILTSPFAHLYANLPRYRYTKHQQQQQHSKQPARDQTTPSQLTTSGLSKQQAAAAMAASAAANLISGSGHSLTPLQAAMLQAQLATSAYLQADLSGGAEQHSMASSTGIGSYSTPADLSTTSGNQPSNSLLSLASGLTGGGVSPQVWRNFLSPIMGARKQQTQSGANQLNGSQKQTTYTTGSNLFKQHPSAQSLALVNSLWGTGVGGASGSFGQVLSSAASSPGSYELQQTRAHAQKKPRLKIKILKIPVAFYDAAVGSSATAGSQTAATETSSSTDGLGSSISLMPAHLQPSPTASLLASLAACPYHAQHQHQLTTGAGATSPLAYPPSRSSPVSDLFGLPNMMSQPPVGYAPTTSADFASPWSQSSSFTLGQGQQGRPGSHGQTTTGKHSQQVGGSAAPSSSHTATASTPTGANQVGQSADHGGKPTPIRDFTDINQPNDLQVSPTSNSNFLPTLMQPQQPQQQQHLQVYLRKSRARK